MDSFTASSLLIKRQSALVPFSTSRRKDTRMPPENPQLVTISRVAIELVNQFLTCNVHHDSVSKLANLITEYNNSKSSDDLTHLPSINVPLLPSQEMMLSSVTSRLPLTSPTGRTASKPSTSAPTALTIPRQNNNIIYIKSTAQLAASTSRPTAFQCSKCDKVYTKHSNMKRHESSAHNQVKAFRCDACNQRFFTNDQLKNHQRTHSGVSLYYCQYCGQNFKTKKYNLDRHLAKQHGIFVKQSKTS